MKQLTLNLKYINLRHHSIREFSKENYINQKYVVSESNLSDGFTKYLDSSKMNKFRDIILNGF